MKISENEASKIVLLFLILHTLSNALANGMHIDSNLG